MTVRAKAMPWSVISTGLLIAAYSVHHILLVEFNLLIWGIKILPLILFLPRLAQNHVRAHQWMGFLSLFYVLDGVLIAAHPQADNWRLLSGILITALALAIYASVILHVRYRKKTTSRRQAAETVDDNNPQ